jgi:hypothetical protein
MYTTMCASFMVGLLGLGLLEDKFHPFTLGTVLIIASIAPTLIWLYARSPGCAIAW